MTPPQPWQQPYDPRFDDIRPYTDLEVPAAMQRIAASEFFATLSAYVFPGEDVAETRRRVAALTTSWDFQRSVMYHFNEQVIRRSCTDFVCTGTERLHHGTSYLFVSNHRDIVLDASLLQYALVNAGFPTSQITFGANLMHPALAVDIGKANKMFRVERAATPKEFYRLSLHLSDYIRHTLVHRGESVWIAQRNGRTKDGDDSTDQGIIKMFAASCAAADVAGRVEAIDSLHLVPVAVSYEWEPCDVLKAFELYARRALSAGQHYVKRPGEDLNSILTGILAWKGRVRLEVCEPLRRDELEACADGSLSDYHRHVAALVDRRIGRAFSLWPNNYIAHDLCSGQVRWADRYTAAQRDAFVARMAELDDLGVSDPAALRDIFLHIYATPVTKASSHEH